MTVMLTALRAVLEAARLAKVGSTHLKQRAARRRTVTALAGLTDRTLRDIGLHRSQICSVAYGNGLHRVRGPAHE